jgi:hypothetical protein
LGKTHFHFQNLNYSEEEISGSNKEYLGEWKKSKEDELQQLWIEQHLRMLLSVGILSNDIDPNGQSQLNDRGMLKLPMMI